MRGLRSAVAIAALLLAAEPLWAPNCVKGKPCGNSCIPQSSTCHIGEAPSHSGGSSSTSASGIYSSGTISVTPSASTTSDIIYTSQLLLRALGYLKTTPSRVRTVNAADAMMQFEREQRLAPTGELSSARMVALAEEVVLRSQATSATRR